MNLAPVIRKVHRIGALGVLALAAGALVLSMAITYLRSPKPQYANAGNAPRQAALLQAAELLAAPGTRAAAPALRPITQASYRTAAADDNTPGTTNLIKPPAVNALPAAQAEAAMSRAEVAEPASAGAAPTTPAPAAGKRRARNAIPATIEDGTPASAATDALAGLVVRSKLRGASVPPTAGSLPLQGSEPATRR